MLCEREWLAGRVLAPDPEAAAGEEVEAGENDGDSGVEAREPRRLGPWPDVGEALESGLSVTVARSGGES